jgi:GNAT superfamily N-acetyltransferase
MKNLKQFILDVSNLNDNKDFVRKIYSKGLQNPIGDGVVFGLRHPETKNMDAGILVDLKPKHDYVYVQEIRVLEGKTAQGFGGHIMKYITDQADKDKIDLSLYAKPLKNEGSMIPKSKLIKFYKKYGFKLERGDDMVRKPK